MKKTRRHFRIKLLLVLLTGGIFCLFYFNYLSITGPKKTAPSAQVSIEIIKFPDGWGYKIEVNKKLFIYQDRIPCIPGKTLFPSRQSAMSVAKLVKEKILQRESPSVSKAEIEKILSKDI